MLTLFHDIPSPAAAVAVWRLQRLADEGYDVAFQGVEMLPLDVALPPTLDQLAERERWLPAARELGLRLGRPTSRPPTVRAHLLGAAAEQAGLGASWREAVYRAYWEDHDDLADPQVLVAIGSAAGLPVGEATAIVADEAAVRVARRAAAALRARGIGGVPVIEMDGTLAPADMPEAELRELAHLGGYPGQT